MQIRQLIIKWLFPTTPEKIIKKLTRKPKKVSIWDSTTEQLGREEVERERAKFEENELPHPFN